ncbi:MAG: hypothetical protein JNK57_07200 [Planctomycetaceae bacterium]|nr:hypothetical protein [Planctomycetaceae bacterium]
MISQTVGLKLLLFFCGVGFGAVFVPGSGTSQWVSAQDGSVVDASTLHHKVLCGYQGWFRCPGDGTDEGWLHWSRRKNLLTPESLTVEMWPDTSALPDAKRYVVPGFTGPDGKSAHLFSSADRETVQQHFAWMRDHGIDGVFVQRFLVNLNKPSFDTVLGHVRKSAQETGRVYAIGYDLSGFPPEHLMEALAEDWRRLVDQEKLKQDGSYLHHHGKPVVFVWGFFDDRFDAKLAHQVIDFFQQDSPYAATLIGGCQWDWRQSPDAEWARAFRRFDVISPWNVGNYQSVGDKKVAATGTWAGDKAEAEQHGAKFLPVVYPGFGWTNLKGPAGSRATIPRRGGEFYWEQFLAAADVGVEMVYVAMFDEVDEATAIFKVSNTPPSQSQFQTLEGRPTDWYLRLTGAGTKLIRGQIKPSRDLPITTDSK